MNITTLDYFDTEIVKELKTKWYSTKTHNVDKIINNDRYIILGVQDKGNYEVATSIYPTFEEKMDKWDTVILTHRSVLDGSILATYILKITS